MKKDKIFITGSAGYIGNHLVKFFKEKKFQVYGCDLKQKNKNNNNFIKSDFSSDRVIKFIKSKNINNIIHLAALTEIKKDKNYSIRCNRVNYLQSKIFYQKIYKEKIFLNNFIFASSASVYGKSKNIRIKENHPTIPISAYGKSKLKFERYLLDNKNNFVNNLFICRFFNVVGGDLVKIKKKNSLFNYIIRSIKNRRNFYINGKNHNTPDGTTVRDYIDIDILSKFINCLLNKKEKNIKKIYNVGSGIGLSILEILKHLSSESFRINYLFRGKKKQDIAHSISNNTLMLKQLDIKKIDLNIKYKLKKFFK